MRHWNYRIVRRVVPPVPESGNEPSVVYAIHDCYYDSKGKVHSFSEEPLAACGESLEELRDDLGRMTSAFNSPVLEYAELPESGAQPDEPPEELPDLDEDEEEETSETESENV